MARPNLRMSAWSLAGSRRVETLLLTSLHVVAKIHAFSPASLALGFSTALRRSAKSTSSLVGVVRGWRGGGACASKGNLSVTSGRRCRGFQGPSSGPIYAWGHGLTYSKRDNDPSLGCNPYRTSPPSPHKPMGAGVGGSGPTCPPDLL